MVYFSWTWALHVTIASIATVTGFATSQVVFALGRIAYGIVDVVVSLLEPAFGDKYNANLHYEKDVKVNGQVVYTTEKTKYNFALAFDGAEADPADLKYRYTDSDFNASNSVLIETGIDIYLENLN